MATDADATPARSDRTRYLVREAAPVVGLVAWFAGLAAIWHFGQPAGWGPGQLVLAGCVWVIVGAAVAHNAIRGMFGPVFMYEVVRLGRKKLTIALRLFYVLGVTALLGLMYFAWLDEVGYFDGRGPDRVPSERLSNFASKFFYTFMVVQYCVVGFLTPAYVAGSIADEKERKTLEFLLATDLQNREIIFGKLAARVTVLLMFVLAGLPVVAFMQLFGGIDPDLLLAGTAATVTTVLGLAAVSVFFSTTMRKPRDAIALTYLAALVYLVASAFLAGYVRFGLLVLPTMRGGGGLGTTDLGDGYVIDWTKVVEAVAAVTDWVAAGNAPYQALWVLTPMGGGMAAISDALLQYAIFWGVASTFFLGYAVFRLRAIAIQQAYGGVKTTRRTGLRGAAFGRSAKPRPRVGDDPMFWKEVFVDTGTRGGCVGRVMGLVIAVLVFLVPALIFWHTYGDLIPILGDLFGPNYHRQSTAERWEDFTDGINVWVRVATGVLGAIVMIAAAVRGSSAVSGERDRDTWVSLVSTPLSAWEMVRGKWLGTILGLRRAYGVLILVWALALACGAVDPPMILVTALYMAVYVSAFAWVGILCSITSRTTLIATVRALMIAVFIGGGFWFFLGVCCALPLSVTFRHSELDVFEHVAQILYGWTPPFVVGWLPLHSYERRDTGIFSWDEGVGIGPLSPVLGFFVWFGLSWVLGLMSWQAFRRVSNRAQDVLDGRLPTRTVRAKSAERAEGEEPIAEE